MLLSDQNKEIRDEEANVCWDIRIQTEKHLPHTPDITIVGKVLKKISGYWI